MKTIVVATDFSASANQAAAFATQLANTHQAALVFVHAFHFWPINPAESGVDAAIGSKAVRDVCQRELDHLVGQLTDRYRPATPIRTVVREGYPMPVICAAAEEEHADLIIMSTVGSTPQSAQLMGSVAISMVAETCVPLLLIPPGATYAELKNVVLGIDLATTTNAVTLDTALRFARQFNCVVDLLCIHAHPNDAQVRSRAEHIRSCMGTIPHTLTILPGEEVYESLLQFAHTHKANLIMILPQKHNWFRKLFIESNTERMARLTDIPLLAIV